MQQPGFNVLVDVQSDQDLVYGLKPKLRRHSLCFCMGPKQIYSLFMIRHMSRYVLVYLHTQQGPLITFTSFSGMPSSELIQSELNYYCPIRFPKSQPCSIMFLWPLFFLWIFNCVSQTTDDGDCIPFGLRLSYGPYYSTSGSNATQMYVTFNTIGNCSGLAYWGNLGSYNSYNCTSQYLPFTWQPPPYFSCTIYTCSITGIDYSQIILYTVSTIDSSNNEYIYQESNVTISLRDWDTPQQTNLLVFGDWSYMPLNSSDNTFAPISNCLNVLKSVNASTVNGILFMGDMAYDLASNNGTNYVEFLKMLQPFSSVWPFMSTIGNHDQISGNDTLVFQASFMYPYIDDNFYYNFTLGQATYIAFNPDAVVYEDADASQVLQNLTELFNTSLSVASTSYVIPFSHFPMFCSLQNVTQCQTNNQSMYALQTLWVDSAIVPLYLSSHVHTYQRSYPIQSSGAVSNDNLTMFSWPQPPIYIIEGASGSSEYLVNESYPLQYFTASQVSGSGYGILTITHDGDILYNHYTGTNCQPADSFYINNVGPSSSSTVFPIWLIVLLCIVAAMLVVSVVWFFYRKRRQEVKSLTASNLESHYKNMELFTS